MMKFNDCREVRKISEGRMDETRKQEENIQGISSDALRMIQTMSFAQLMAEVKR